ncbi:hypothetical protein [Leptospira sarikeiensis]|uniref:DUF2207 domain-containing protein n=1 Tax=Leptospira sarikeiensis TaxID=2484943 RepID=A0A4V3JRN9_9LEPT|nr:hypothetical protein [Leptospira sarikeiensis]TGL61012.1 hypothetical protein EHQ64_14550 [Leptospira sarikeiensis]
MFEKKVFIIILLFLYFCKPSEQSSGNPTSLDHETIRIEFIDEKTVKVRVDFFFSGLSLDGQELAFPETPSFPLRKFEVSYNDQFYSINRRTAGKGKTYVLGKEQYPSIFPFTVSKIEPDEHGFRHLIVSYEFTPPYFSSKAKNDQPAGYYLEYIMKTGETWKGAISDVKASIHTGKLLCENLFLLEGSISGECVSENIWESHITNLEPKNDYKLILKD